MIAPTKGIAPQRALLSVGGQIAKCLDSPVTVSQAWNRFLKWREENDHRAPIPFWWFALALDTLFSLGVIDFDGELLTVRSVDASASSRK
ncbi:ABC-three component system middle component 6 [Qaidamihabitans albus]|uniref:ABC-three component system middle component 6 n=1 Tax=Qaidamihabitans albus TaxID=2795733 RepID=UPI0018F10B47|nr:ABC-three component system middle component 6 [Qaidamihabitans albus]